MQLKATQLCPQVFSVNGSVIIYHRGGGPFNVTSLKWFPLKTIDDFLDPPPPPDVFIFQANLSGSPSASFQSYHRFPFLGSQLWLIPPFVLPKIKWSPLKSFAPPPAINNDQSLTVH